MGDDRVIFEIDDTERIVEVLEIGHHRHRL
ncbi:MAG: type II toxin-antitoxin system RelE/ParE family toxin [Dehalococcoidia bacterium]